MNDDTLWTECIKQNSTVYISVSQPVGRKTFLVLFQTVISCKANLISYIGIKKRQNKSILAP